jgi:hypothetical protein
MRNPPVVIEPRILLEEHEIPESLKPAILRIAQMTLDFAEQAQFGSHGDWTLERDDQTLRLSIDIAADSQNPGPCSATGPVGAPPTHDYLEAIRAQVMLSAGSSDACNEGGGVRTISTWLLDESVQA